MANTNDIEEHDNVYDFIEFKMHQLIEQIAQTGQTDMALAISNALDAYLQGEIDIDFVDGWPVAYEIEHNETPSDIE
jgi:hypothetical protein